MERLSRYGIVVARILIAIFFMLNALGVIDQSIPARDMAQRGVVNRLLVYTPRGQHPIARTE